MQNHFKIIAEKYHDAIVKTAVELIQINSQSKSEGALAKYIVDKMNTLGYDNVWVDKYGNIFGTIKGTGGGSSVNLNCHSDVVDEGNHKNWKYPPFSGTIVDGKIWGRGASDTKGTFAVQLYTPIMLRENNLLPKGDIVVSCVVCEEIGGFGSMMQAKDNSMLCDYCIIGEATENELAISCRGRFCPVVTIKGAACHASVPHMGKNPFSFLGRFLLELENVEMGYTEAEGYSTMSVTSITSSEKSTNIIPNEVVVYIDYRQVACDTTDVVIEKLEKAASRCKVDGISVDIHPYYFPIETYTGFKGNAFEGEPPFTVNGDAEHVILCKKFLEEAVNREISLFSWSFATDTGHFSQKGVKCIGYSPAEIKYCHTTQDNIDLEMLKESQIGYMALTYGLCNLEK